MTPGRRRALAAVAVAAALAAAVLLGTAAALDRLLPLPLDRLRDLSAVVVDHDGAALRVFTGREGMWRLPATVDDVAPVYLDLLLAVEDRRFFRHAGVDPLAVLRAAGQNLGAGRVVSGASTLTMQVARLLEPRPRTLRAKLIEALRAAQLEWRYSKREILGMYLTLAPFGGNVEGVRAASLTLFGKEPNGLTAAEAALLVALPQAPSRLRPDRAGDAARARRDTVLDRAAAAGALAPGRAAEARDEPVPQHPRRPLPASAAHLAERRHREDPGATVLPTTLDGSLQRSVEALAARELPGLLERAGLAVLVVDNRRRELRAHLGAPAAFDDQRLGWIDMTEAPRSPGSTLKPFIYGLGFDDRVIHPQTLIADVSTRFGDYAPQNFDQAFHGELTVREALQRSLNVPAVLVLDRVGPLRFAEALRRAGATPRLPRDAGPPGLPLALGGASVSLRELVTLYVALARGGVAAPLVDRPDTPSDEEGYRLLSAESAAEVLRILQGAAPAPGLVQAAERRQRGALAVKTGTSYGFRDAWALGVGRRYTVGVWVGRPDGTPSPDHTGRAAALPILYKVFDLLPEDGPAVATTPALPAPPPELLHRLRAGTRDPDGLVRLPDPEHLSLTFPRPGSELELSRSDGDMDTLVLSARGGRRPLSWLVDGRPLTAAAGRRDAEWRPDRPGRARITVIDADGRSDAAEVVVR